MRMMDGEPNSVPRNAGHTDTEPSKDYADDGEQIADDDDAADKDMLHDDSDSNILKRLPDGVQSQVRTCSSDAESNVNWIGG